MEIIADANGRIIATDSKTEALGSAKQSGTNTECRADLASSTWTGSACRRTVC
jgi:hypothetical protein